MSDKAWKAAERRAARQLGAERTPLSGGGSRHTRSDSLHEQIYIETKYRKVHSVWTLYEDTKEKAASEGKLPVVALQQYRKHGMLWVVHSSDLIAFAKAILAANHDPERHPL